LETEVYATRLLDCSNGRPARSAYRRRHRRGRHKSGLRRPLFGGTHGRKRPTRRLLSTIELERRAATKLAG
jgi:hypothetical protein